MTAPGEGLVRPSERSSPPRPFGGMSEGPHRAVRALATRNRASAEADVSR
ncbi:hypothetical protein KPATCC21470_2682 [Kitasatospora purpeofusca]